MTQEIETYVRWEPIPNLPEFPIGSVRFSYDGQSLSIAARYSFDPASHVLHLGFSPRAFKAYEEHSDPWMENKPQTPNVFNQTLNQWAWPVQEVLNSKWLARVVERDGGIDDCPWRHFVIVSADLCLHIMATEPDLVEIIKGAVIPQ